MLCGNNEIGKEKKDNGNRFFMVGYRDGYVKIWDIRVIVNF